MKLKNAKKLANDLIKEHKLIAWEFGFDTSVRRFGLCNYTKRKISLSAKLTELNSIQEVTSTILHEIAHALAPMGSGHNEAWRKIAISIGDDGGRVYDSVRVITPPKKYIATCRNGHVALRNKKGKISCGRCSPRFNKKYLFKYKLNPEYT